MSDGEMCGIIMEDGSVVGLPRGELKKAIRMMKKEIAMMELPN